MTRITFALFAIFLCLLGCSGYELESKRYQVEKAYFEAEKLVDNYSVKPELRTQQDYYLLVDAYMAVFRKFSENFSNLTTADNLAPAAADASNLAGRSLLSASALLLSAEAIDSAKNVLDYIINSPIMLPPHRFDALYAAGNIAEQQGRWFDAEQLYLQLLKEYYPPAIRGTLANNNVMELPKKLAEHYADIGEREEARKRALWAVDYYKGIVDSFPKVPMTMLATRLLAEMYSATGEFQKAVNMLETVVDSSGRMFDPARSMMADLYLTRLNRGPEAVRIYNEIIADGQDSLSIATSYMKLATLAFGDERYQDGRDHLEKLRQRFPRLANVQAQAQLLKARSFESEKNNERARQEYVALLNEFPNSIQALEVLAYMPEYFQRIGQPGLEQEWLRRSEQEIRNMAESNLNRRIGLQASSYLGTFLQRHNRFDDAITQFETLIKQYPRSPQAAEALYKIGYIYRNDLKKDDKALEAFREFLKQYPNSGVRPSVEAEIRKIEQS
ncbi:MAG: tetratricopeptide repeat protein [Candidatus Zixiibacteriota bacterium]